MSAKEKSESKAQVVGGAASRPKRFQLQIRDVKRGIEVLVIDGAAIMQADTDLFAEAERAREVVANYVQNVSGLSSGRKFTLSLNAGSSDTEVVAAASKCARLIGNARYEKLCRGGGKYGPSRKEKRWDDKHLLEKVREQMREHGLAMSLVEAKPARGEERLVRERLVRAVVERVGGMIGLTLPVAPDKLAEDVVLRLAEMVEAAEGRARQLEEALEQERDARKRAEAQLQELKKLGLPKVGGAPPDPAPAPVPAVIEPLPQDLESTLGREVIWSLVRPNGVRGGMERHEVFWRRFDQVLEERGPEGTRVLRKPLQDYLDAVVGIDFDRGCKKKLASRICLMARAIGMRLEFEGVVGSLAAYGHKGAGGFRIQYSDPNAGAGRAYKGLGASLPAGLRLAVAVPRRDPRMDSKMGRYKHL